MVRCGNGKLYTGWTTDVEARLKAHQSGKGAKYTRAFKAVELAYACRMPSKSEGLKREAAIKKLTKAQKEALCAKWSSEQTKGGGE